MTETTSASALDEFTERNARTMRERLTHGARKFGALAWRDGSYTDDLNQKRLTRAVTHLQGVLLLYRTGRVGEDELQKRAADVANQAFMLADPRRQARGEPIERGWADE